MKCSYKNSVGIFFEIGKKGLDLSTWLKLKEELYNTQQISIEIFSSIQNKAFELIK
jgi:hypothetical protein